MTPIDLLLWALAVLFAVLVLAVIAVIVTGIVRAFKPTPPKNTDHNIL